MSYYYCSNCGEDESCFPQLYVMINSEIVYDPNNYYSKFNNTFENKFREIVEEIAKEKKVSPSAIYNYHIEEVYIKYNKWLFDTQHLCFCSLKCAIEYLGKNDILIPCGGN